MKVYLAGKITKNGWRNNIFKGLRSFKENDWYFDSSYGRRHYLAADGYEYVGPYFLADDHGSFHGEGTHGRGVNKNENPMMNPNWRESQRSVVSKCFEWINECDKLFVWLDSADAFGTITEIGYAKALNKPIFFALDAKLKGTIFEEDIWFVINTAYDFVYCDNAEQAWEVFTGKTKITKIERASSAQVDYILELSRKAGKRAISSLEDISKDTAGKMLGYFLKNKYVEEVEPMFQSMTKKQAEKATKEIPQFKATDVVIAIKDHFKDVEGFKFNLNRHTGYVKKHKAKEKTKFSKTLDNPVSTFSPGTTYYTKVWIEFLIKKLEKEIQ